MNIVVHVSLLHVGVSLEYMPRSGITGSSGCTMYNFLRNRQPNFQSGCISLQPHQQWRGVPLSPHSRQHLLSPEVFILAILDLLLLAELLYQASIGEDVPSPIGVCSPRTEWYPRRHLVL